MYIHIYIYIWWRYDKYSGFVQTEQKLPMKEKRPRSDIVLITYRVIATATDEIPAAYRVGSVETHINRNTPH